MTESSALRYQILNPATGQVEETFETATDADVAAALDTTQAAYAEWGARPMAERVAIGQKIAELFYERKEELGRIATREMGKPLSESIGEAEFCGDIFKYYADNAEKFTADQEIESFIGGKAIIQRRPVGPLLGIMPWNYPYYQIARFAAPNLMLGNTIILKHAETVPGSALAMQKLLDDAGVPQGVYQNLFATHEQIADIIADPRIQGVSVTGSERAGSAVASLAGKHLKKSVMELGGSDPFVVLDSADVSETVETAWATRIENTGQACNSNKRMIVTEEIFDDFVAGLVEKANGLVPGDPAEEKEGTFAPLSSRAAAEKLHEQVQDAVSKGATLHVGGELLDGPASYYSPAVLTGITKEMRAYSEELFGPVAAVYKVANDDEALKLANDTAFGLGGSVFSTDVERARKVAEKLEVGMTNVNAPGAESFEMPFGGVKRSGFGRELGPLGMDEFVNKRLLYIAD
ncbi:NAD-dependent succinate-semialdehyde dehydrogenase [Zhihengliuella sp.]|uniref:NAD-dependent succinate-semialdehyde dehydrogenase n=1 Tax=Zhihengliuella sp. TaxID=1954483 RepID=UPI0028122230|nr:NAD-dependent succinate-semialdehyde dehydrogenase [Zhihengliuella sp.]